MNKFFIRKEAAWYENALRTGRAKLGKALNTAITSSPELAQYVYDLFMKPRGGNPANSLVNRFRRRLVNTTDAVKWDAANAINSRKMFGLPTKLNESDFGHAVQDYLNGIDAIDRGISSFKKALPQGWSHKSTKAPADAGKQYIEQGADLVRKSKSVFDKIRVK